LNQLDKDPFEIVPGRGPHEAVAIGAPHHGTQPNTEADLGTGPIALALADRLGARAVVVRDLRSTVDVNKNPLTHPQDVRRLSIRYQDELFRGIPRLLIEIHGHVSGRYAVELSTGFELDPQRPADASFLEKLRLLKQSLTTALGSRVGNQPSVGLYPLDRNVTKIATHTYTFQKVRRLRNLGGLEVYGLHIELNAELRNNPPSRNPVFIDTLVRGLSASIQAAFDPLPPAGSCLTSEIVDPGPPLAVVARAPLSVARIPAQFVDSPQVIVHPQTLAILGGRPGDLVTLSNAGEQLRTTIHPSPLIPAGQAALPARLRRQIGLALGSAVTVGLLAPAAAVGVAAEPDPGEDRQPLSVCETRPGNGLRLWMSPTRLDRLQPALGAGAALLVVGQPSLPPLGDVQIASDPALPERLAAASQEVMDRLVLTLGEVITLRPG
jgi:hypothetical protein